MIEPAIYSKVTTDAGVIALIDTRLYPQYARQADQTYPLAVYQVDAVTPTTTNTGSAGLESATVSIAAIARDPKAADQGARAIITALDCQKGVWGGVTVQGVFLDDDGIEDDTVTDPTTEAILFYVKTVSFTAWYATD